MNSKAFRRNHAPKPNSTFISLHFNKSDEEQLEISYKKGTEEAPHKNVLDVSQSNFYVADSKKISDSPFSQEVKNNKSAAVKGCTNSVDGVSKESSKDPFPGSQYSVAAKSEPNAEDVVDFQTVADLSPAIEADEVVDSDTFNHYISNKLEKAKCEILDLKKERPPSLSESEKHTKKPFCPADLPERTDCNEVVSSDQSYFNFAVQNSISLMRYAQNSVKFHLFIALFAFTCAPIPSWLSGFMVGALLSSSLVYWLYKPQKNRRGLHCVSPSIAYFQEESGILKVSL